MVYIVCWISLRLGFLAILIFTHPISLGYSKAKIATAMADLKGDRITEGCIL